MFSDWVPFGPVAHDSLMLGFGVTKTLYPKRFGCLKLTRNPGPEVVKASQKLL